MNLQWITRSAELGLFRVDFDANIVHGTQMGQYEGWRLTFISTLQ